MVVITTAIVGATISALKGLKEICTYINECIEAKDEAKNLSTSYELNYGRLEKLLEFFQSPKTHRYMEKSLAERVENACEHLRNFVRTIELKINSNDPTKGHSQFRLLKWPFVVATLKEGDRRLTEWLGRLSDLLRELPLELAREASRGFLSPSGREEFFPLHEFARHLEEKMQQEQRALKDKAWLLSTCQSEPLQSLSNPWVDIIHVPDDLSKQIEKDNHRLFKLEVARLYQLLRSTKSDSSFLPQARCWFEILGGEKLAREFHIVYEIPNGIYKADNNDKAYTLKDIIKQAPRHSLEARITLMIQLTRAVVYIHALQWVHKSLHPENVLLLFDVDQLSAEKGGVGRVLLKGFDIARRAPPTTKSTGYSSARLNPDNEDRWRYQVYTHPSRQLVSLEAELETYHSLMKGEDPPGYEFYTYMHDVYSLGVMLLEIGLWSDITPDGSTLESMTPEKRCAELKSKLDLLSISMGHRLTVIVESCLNGNVKNRSQTAAMVLDSLHEIKL